LYLSKQNASEPGLNPPIPNPEQRYRWVSVIIMVVNVPQITQ